MTKTNRNHRNLGSDGKYYSKPHHLFKACQTPDKPAATANLSHTAYRLLDNLLAQYNGYNNGDLCASMTVMKLYGWTSSGTVNNAVKELIAEGFIEKTRQGGRNQCSLYAVTWKPINECNGKHNVKETSKPSNLWKPENLEHRD